MHRFAAIDTKGQINAERPLADRPKNGIVDLCEGLDRTWSRFRDD